MEENYVVLREIGIVDAPVSGYNTIYWLTSAAMMAPVLITCYFYILYKLYLYLRVKY